LLLLPVENGLAERMRNISISQLWVMTVTVYAENLLQSVVVLPTAGTVKRVAVSDMNVAIVHE
jgi:hypothetical protein